MKQHKRRALALCLAAVILAGAAAGVYLHRRGADIPAGSALPILMYHHIVTNEADCTNDMIVTAAQLEEDLRWLQDNGYTTILPRDLVSGAALPEKPVLLTFDDGYRSNYELLYPLLQKYGMHAAIAVITSLPDSGNDAYLTWDMCREMADSGLVEIGSHTNNLHNLGELQGNYKIGGPNGIERKSGESDSAFQTRVLDDLQKSHDLIEEQLGREVTFFAYPFGVTEPDAEALLETLFPVTVTTKSGTADLRRGTWQMPRYTICMSAAPEKYLDAEQ